MAIRAATQPRKRLIQNRKTRPKRGHTIAGLAAKRRFHQQNVGIRGVAKQAMLKSRRTNLWRRKHKRKRS